MSSAEGFTWVWRHTLIGVQGPVACGGADIFWGLPAVLHPGGYVVSAVSL